MLTSLCINKVVKTLNVPVLRNGMFSEPTGAINAPNHLSSDRSLRQNSDQACLITKLFRPGISPPIALASASRSEADSCYFTD